MDEFESDLFDRNFTASEIDLNSCEEVAPGIYLVHLIPGFPVEVIAVYKEKIIYFKARGEHWQFSIGSSLNEAVEGESFFMRVKTNDASKIEYEGAKKLIDDMVKLANSLGL